jgi:hypothetical protein
MDIARRSLLMAAGGLVTSVFCPRAMFGGRAAAGFKQTMTTLFWVGEPADSENAFIPNDQSYWDEDWQSHYGGMDDPERRDGHWPANFRPKENPFYVALPYGEFTEAGELKPEAQGIPWFYRGLSPLLKNHWIEVLLNGRSCFAQWQDVGPCGEDDFDFVFGNAVEPLNTFDAKAGLDVSPAVWRYLGMNGNCITAWRFIDVRDVPSGPWTEIVTVSGNNR